MLQIVKAGLEEEVERLQGEVNAKIEQEVQGEVDETQKQMVE